MTRWRKHIQLKDLLGDESDEITVRLAAGGITSRLKRLPEYGDDSELEAVVTCFEDIADVSIPAATLSGRMPLVDYFNDVLNALYDWADDERIWIE